MLSPRRIVHVSAALSIVLAAVATPAPAQTSTNSISLQAKLTGVPDGNVSLTVKFYDAATGGTQQGTTITLSGVAVQGGVVSVPVSPIDPTVFNGATRYMGISVNGGAELSPRTLVTSVPYAVSSLAVQQAADTTGPRLSQHRLMLGSESTNESNLVMQIDSPGSATMRGVIQCVKSQGGSVSHPQWEVDGGVT